jgi:hypothetical protein
MPKRNVYFTDEQVAEMKKYPEENWSSVCQEAVGARLKFLDLKSAINSSAVERAKARLGEAKAAFKTEYGANARERGERAGMSWAADKATLTALMNMERACSGEDPTFCITAEGSGNDARSIEIVIAIARIIAGATGEDVYTSDPDDNDLRMARELVQAVCVPKLYSGTDPLNYEDVDSIDFWEGMYFGAMRIYEEV